MEQFSVLSVHTAYGRISDPVHGYCVILHLKIRNRRRNGCKQLVIELCTVQYVLNINGGFVGYVGNMDGDQ
jgi:hypothetical protein